MESDNTKHLVFAGIHIDRGAYEAHVQRDEPFQRCNDCGGLGHGGRNVECLARGVVSIIDGSKCATCGGLGYHFAESSQPWPSLL